MIRSFCFALISAVLAFAFLPSAWAYPVTWTLSGATFNDGGTATGSFVYDADTNVVSNWSVSVAGGTTVASFPPITYIPSNSTATYDASQPTLFGLTLYLNSSARYIDPPTVSALTDAGGTIAINLASDFAVECYSCAPYRMFTAGSLVGTAPPAITSANSSMFALGVAGSFTITSAGAPSATISGVGTLPSGVTFTNNGDGTATLAGTPTIGSLGNHAITLTASNGIGSNATQVFTLIIKDVIFADGFDGAD